MYEGEIGEYIKMPEAVETWSYTGKHYGEGTSYSMKSHEIHSTLFSKGAVVLFFEGPELSKHSTCLEPVVNGKHIETMTVQPWMFSKE